VFKSVRSRLIASFALIVIITLTVAGLAFAARFGGYRDELTAQTLRSVAAPVYYNLTLFPGANIAAQPNAGRRLRSELTDYLRLQSENSGVIVLLIDANGNVIDDNASVDPALASEHFSVPAEPQRGPNFSELPEGTHRLASGATVLYVAVPTPKAVRAQPAGVAAIVVALPKATAGDVFRDLARRLIFAGGIALGAALLVALVLWAWMYRPLGQVTAAIRAIARGDYRRRLAVEGPSEVRALASDVNTMADSVETSQRALREFLANVSHELRTPLTSIRGFSQAMLDGTLATPEERERAARVIDVEARRVLHLVGELLDLSRIESGQQPMRLARVPAAELIAHMNDVFSMRAGEQQIELSASAPPGLSVMADFDRVEQVLGNLLDNAFRHTPRGGRISAGVRALSGGLAEFFVTDSGTGIPPEELPHIFDRFYRSSGETQGTVAGLGLGLGLAISREIVRAHGGDIRAEAAPAGGTTLAFTLRLERPAEARPAPGAADRAAELREQGAGG